MEQIFKLLPKRPNAVFFLGLILQICLWASTGCQPHKNNNGAFDESISPPPEIKVEVSKSDLLKRNTSLLPQLNRTWDHLLTSDELNFQLKIQTNKDPIKLVWSSKCQLGDKQDSYQGMLMLPIAVRVSELIPPSFFFNVKENYPKDLLCHFLFEAQQESTHASHTFDYETSVYMDHGGNIEIKNPQSQNKIEDHPQLVVVMDKIFQHQFLTFPSEQHLELNCTHFRSPLLVESTKNLTLSSPVWIDDQVESKDPLAEFPLQICRILGRRDRTVSSWSPYFILKSETGSLQISWTSSPEVNRYILNSPPPSFDLGRFHLQNNLNYSRLIRIPKLATFELIPVCQADLKSRSTPRYRILPGEIASSGNVTIFTESSEFWIIKIGPHSSAQIIYRNNFSLRCRCPYATVGITAQALALAKLKDKETGFFSHYHGAHSPSLVELISHPSEVGSFVELSSWQSAPVAYGWVTAVRPPSISDTLEYIATPDMLQIEPLSFICDP